MVAESAQSIPQGVQSLALRKSGPLGHCTCVFSRVRTSGEGLVRKHKSVTFPVPPDPGRERC
jgi:hypothetical protein